MAVLVDNVSNDSNTGSAGDGGGMISSVVGGGGKWITPIERVIDFHFTIDTVLEKGGETKVRIGAHHQQGGTVPWGEMGA